MTEEQIPTCCGDSKCNGRHVTLIVNKQEASERIKNLDLMLNLNDKERSCFYSAKDMLRIAKEMGLGVKLTSIRTNSKDKTLTLLIELTEQVYETTIPFTNDIQGVYMNCLSRAIYQELENEIDSCLPEGYSYDLRLNELLQKRKHNKNKNTKTVKKKNIIKVGTIELIGAKQ